MTVTREELTQEETGHPYDKIDGDDPRSRSAFLAAVRNERYPVMPDAVTQSIRVRDELASYQANRAAPPQPLSAGSLTQFVFERAADTDVAAAVRAAVDDAAEHEENLKRQVLTSKLIHNTLMQFDAYISGVVTDHLPSILGGLREQLTNVVADLRSGYEAIGDLDIHQPDPMDVAAATTAQRKGLLTVAENTKRYRQLRYLQRTVLTASAAPIPGGSPYNAGLWTWSDVFATGIHEVRSPDNLRAPGQGAPPRAAVRAVVERNDVWLPDIEEMTGALEAMQNTVLDEKSVRDKALRDRDGRAQKRERQHRDASARMRAEDAADQERMVQRANHARGAEVEVEGGRP